MEAKSHLRNWREAKGMGVQAAASAVEVSRQTWWRWETGASNVELERLDKVADVTGIPHHQLRPDLAAMFTREAAQ